MVVHLRDHQTGQLLVREGVILGQFLTAVSRVMVEGLLASAEYAATRRKVPTSYDHSQRLQGVGNLRPELVDYLIQLPQREHLQLRFRLAQKRYDTTWGEGRAGELLDGA